MLTIIIVKHALCFGPSYMLVVPRLLCMVFGSDILCICLCRSTCGVVFSFSSEHNIVHLYPLCDNIMDGVIYGALVRTSSGQVYMMYIVFAGHKYNYNTARAEER